MGPVRGGGGGQGRCEQRSEVFVKIQKDKFFGGWGGVRSGGGQGGCERRIEVFVKIKKKKCEPRIEGIKQCTNRYCLFVCLCLTTHQP